MIDIRFLGSGGISSKRPKNTLSKEYRRFPSVLINSHILIDISEDLFEFSETFQMDEIPFNIRYILITHSHLDHLSISAIEELARHSRIEVFATFPVISRLDGCGAILHEISPFGKFTVDGIDIIPLPANHITEDVSETALNFLIMGEKNIFYGADGAFINPHAFQILKEIKLNLAILDCGLGDGGFSGISVYHNNIEMVRIIRQILINQKIVDAGTKFVVTHIPSAKKRDMAESLTAIIGDEPINVAYDGYYIFI